MSARTTEVTLVGKLLFPRVSGRDIVLTDHALRSMLHRSVTLEEVHDILANWENRWQSTRYKDEVITDDVFLYQKGKLALVVKELRTCVLVKTVLLREQRQWSDDDAKARTT